MRLGLGLGISKSVLVSSITLGQTMATDHYNRITADGGLLPAGVSGLASVLDSVIAAYSVTDPADFNTKVPVFLDPHYTGYKLGAGAGTTLGQAATTVYAIDQQADVTQATAASQPLLLAHSGTNYWWGSGVASNYVSTPSSVANSIVGDIEIIAKVNMPNLTTQFNIIGKYGNTALSQNYILYINSSNKIAFAYNNGQTQISSVIQPYAANTDFWVKCTRALISGDIYFYTSSNGTTWTQLGTLVSSVAGAITTSTQQVEVGSLLSGGIVTTGKIYRATISSTIGGTPVVDFNPASYSASTSQTAWTSSTGEVWTINKSTGQTLTGVLVDKSQIQVVRALLSMATGTGTTFLSGNNVLYSQYVVSKGCENQVQQSPISLRGTGSSGTDFTSASSNKIAFYGIDNAGAVRRFDPANAANFNLALYTIIGDTTTTAYQNNNIGAASSSSTTQGQTTINQIRIGTAYNYNGFTGNIASIIIASTADNSTTRTSLYNIIRSMNNNAF